MCGIAGFWKAEGLEDTAETKLRKMIEVQVHRGPDGQGVHLDREKGLALGHARLSIIDLSDTGAQPLCAGDKSLALVVNGEIYDYKRIRSVLMTEGGQFKTKSDSEILLPLYRKFGLDLMPWVRGEFAFALYDRKEDRLVLVRDRFGVRPLFYHIDRDCRNLYFGSEVKVLLANSDVPKRINRQAVLNQLMHTMVPGTSSFEGIEALEPGHMLIVTRRKGMLEFKKQKYWDLDFPATEARDAGITPEEHIQSVRHKLVESVVQRLEADVPVGCYLSGGIDSCSILGMASGAMQSPVKAFTISFDSADYDESKIAKEMAESVGSDQDMIHLAAAELYGENYIKTVYHSERTFYNTLGVAKYCMSRHVREAGYKTVITGEGSDELFGGYPAFKRDMFLHGLADEPGSVRREYQEALERSNRMFKGAILSENAETHPAWESLCGFTPSWIQSWIATCRLARPLLSDEMQDHLKDYDPVAEIASKIDPKMLEERHPLDRAQYTWSKTMLEGQILNWGGDRVDMAHSMESRPAFLDHHVAEVAVQVPPHLRIKGNIEKWVLREAVRGVLPEVLYKREKFAFMAPPAHTDPVKLKAVQALRSEFASEARIKGAGFFDPGRLDTFFREYETETDGTKLVRKDALINHILCLQILHHHFLA